MSACDVLLVNSGLIDRREVTPVKSIYHLNVVVKQEILTKTQNTKQATYCPVTCSSVPFIARYCVLTHVGYALKKKPKSKYSVSSV